MPFETACVVAHICSRCLATKPQYDKHRALFAFNAASQKIIHALKYHGAFWIKKVLRPYLTPLAPEFAETDLITAVPLHKNRLRERGYNQSLLLAALWQEVLQRSINRTLVCRSMHTPAQTGLSLKERKNNLRHAFLVPNPLIVKDKTVLMVDDVHTTGTTLNEVAFALKKAGAKKVFAFTIAIVPNRVTASLLKR